MMQEIILILKEIQRNSLLAAKQVLSIDDVATLTGLSRSHLYKLTSANEIPHYKPNSRLLYFDKTEVENWMKRNRVGADNEAEEYAVGYMVRKEAIK
jgi:hypothetical protein